MTDRFRLPVSVRRAAVAGALSLGALTMATTGLTQELKDVQSPSTPLVLKSPGSFIVGGESVLQAPAQLSSFTDQPLDSGGHVTINQMYIEYMVPMVETGIPVIMLHGATLSGKSYDTTPDGQLSTLARPHSPAARRAVARWMGGRARWRDRAPWDGHSRVPRVAWYWSSLPFDRPHA